MGRTGRFLLAAVALGMTAVAAPLTRPVQASTAAAAGSTPRECASATDYAGRGDIMAVCVYDNGRGYRFGRIAYRNPNSTTTVHQMNVALYECQAGPTNCRLVGYDFREDVWLYYNQRLTAETHHAKAKYGWVYQACGRVYATSHNDQHWFDRELCTPFLPGAPRVSIITG